MLENGKERNKELIFDKYGDDFLTSKNCRECCYDCHYASLTSRPGDISIGDFWGIHERKPKYANHLGVSSIVVNTKKGHNFIVNNSFDVFECNEQDILCKQENLISPTSRPKERDLYYNNFDESIFIRRKTSFHLKRRIIKLIPKTIRRLIKKIINKK